MNEYSLNKTRQNNYEWIFLKQDKTIMNEYSLNKTWQNNYEWIFLKQDKTKQLWMNFL